jgi:hypothetical protein
MHCGDLPHDPGLPALEAFREHGLDQVLAPHGVPVPRRDLRVLQHHPGLRCALLVEAADGLVVVKAYAEDPAPLVAVLRAVDRAGLADGRAPTVPPLRAWDPALAFIVTPVLPGRSARELVAGGVPERAGALAAGWLRAAASRPLSVGRRHGPDALLAEARFSAPQRDAVARALQAEGSRRLAALATDPPPGGRPALVHGSFVPRHLVELPDGPGLVDVDALGHGPLELDAAMMLASLRRLALGRRAQAVAAQRAAQVFRDGVADLVDAEALEWYRAAQLVKLAGRVVEQRPARWAERAHALLADAAAATGNGR